ncbi:glycosyltransferase family 2 protein [Azohydromonas australica]|uniref:glycosyltransferase family 2 protein n=1 Tax=Azohydromonas australica TaxID=364039 RepID=UPI0003F78B79|nr:glycosyltransferase family 2 protein [Azohydromonas australica]
MQISVLMPSYNQAPFIERSVRSVMQQEGAGALELIVMDGGSSDGTPQLLAQLQAEYGPERLRWQSEPDRGPAHALNKALALARGSIIGWLNSDDLYAPGAVRRALEHLAAYPQHWMVYGQAEHIDADDRVLEAYPTRPAEAGLDGFADGCFICQPSVFLRRMALRMLGGFDESQKTAFDLALWLRLFGPHAARIGFIEALQARSRLHDACITLTQRERVIRESMALLARHLGAAPLHWVQTYVDEVLAEHPFGAVQDPRAHLHEFAASVQPLLSAADIAALKAWLVNDARVRLAQPGVGLALYADGWLPVSSELRLGAGPARVVELAGRHVSPAGTALELALELPGGTQLRHVSQRGPFSVRFELPPHAAQRWILPLTARGGFVPAQHEASSTDNRDLACRIDSVRLFQ